MILLSALFSPSSDSFIDFLEQFIGATARFLYLSCSNATMINYYSLDFSVNLLGPCSSETFLWDLGKSNEGILGIAYRPISSKHQRIV